MIDKELIVSLLTKTIEMRYLFILFFLLNSCLLYAQNEMLLPDEIKNKFKFIEIKAHFGAFLKSNGNLKANGLLDNGYGSVNFKIGWQPTHPTSWASRYNYPAYGFGFYSGFLSDARVFGNPNAVFGFIRFPLSPPESRNTFSIEPALGLTYKLNPYNSETNPLNDAIGARMAVYFNLNFGFTYKWTREVDLLYGFDFTHLSNGSTYKPNSGLNLYGFNVGLRYNYNVNQIKQNIDIYSNAMLPARFKRPYSSPMNTTKYKFLSVYLAGGLGQTDEMIGSSTLMGVFSGIIDLEYKFNEMHGINMGIDMMYDNRLRDLVASQRWMPALHTGYTFSFYKFDIKIQLGTYLGKQNGKGDFFMRPALRYHLTDKVFAQVGLKTLDGGKADYIEYGFGFRPFSW